jgi:transposase
VGRRDVAIADRDESIAEHQQAIVEQQQSMLEQQRVLSDQQQALADRDRQLSEREAELGNAAALVEKLKFEIARYRGWRFGKKSEAIGAEQILLWQAELDADIEALQRRLEDLKNKALGSKTAPDKDKPRRQALPATLPRIEERLEPDSMVCGCGQALVRIGEDVAETLEMIPSRFWVKRRIRGKWACRCCERLEMAPVPAAAIDKSIAGASVLANVVVAKYVDHQPLYRQESIYARMGVEISRSTQAGWIGQIDVSVEPLVDRLASAVVAASGLQADETPVPVLAPGTGKTATGYLWAYRTLPSDTVQAVFYDFAMNRSQQHPKRVLGGFAGTLQVDGYCGYNEVLSRERVIEAGCLAHARRKLVDVFKVTGSPIAKEAIARIGALYKIEHDIDDLGVSIVERQRIRHERSRPLMDALHDWIELCRARTSPRSSLAQALQYSLNRWTALCRFLDDGRLPLDTNAVENAMRPVCLGRRNWLFAGSEAGGQRAARIYSLLVTAKLNGHEPLAYFTDVLERLPTARMRDLDALLPWNWQPSASVDVAAALQASHGSPTFVPD